MEHSIKRTDLFWEEGKLIAGQKAGRHVGEQSYISFFNEAEGMAKTTLPYADTGKRQYPTKNNHSIMLFFQKKTTKPKK